MTEAVRSDAFFYLNSAGCDSNFYKIHRSRGPLQTLHITINGIFELGVTKRVPHVRARSLSTDSMHFRHTIASFSFEKRSCQIFASSGEIVGSVSFPGPGFRGPLRRACARALE